MCLDHVTWIYKNKFRHEDKVQEGYKVFEVRTRYVEMEKTGERELIFQFGFQNKSRAAPISRWLKSELDRPNLNKGDYEIGFHLFRTKKEATKFLNAVNQYFRTVIIKIKYKGIKAKGYQHGAEIIVADKILIPKAEYLKATADILVTEKTTVSK